MMVHKAGKKFNRAGFWDTAGMAWMVCAASVCAWAGSFTLYAQAAPATLASTDATVYEQASEGSSPVGNLVEGSTFEYIGDVTAEDGSVWRQVTTASGTNGYIRGDREMEIGTEEPAQEEPEASPEERVPARNEGEDDGGRAGDDEEELSEEGDAISNALEGNNLVQDVMDMQNNQTKKYALVPSGKIKERENSVSPNIEILDVKKTGTGIDKTLLAGIAVVFFCVVTVYICLTRMRLLIGRTDSRGIQDAGRGKTRRKTEKKKYSQKRRTKKAIQGRKEAGKIPREKS